MAFATCAAPMASALEKEFPEVETATRLQPVSVIINSANDVFREEGFFQADQSLFSVFSFHFLEGNPHEALRQPNAIVLTKSMEKKYFGNELALGKTMICNQQKLLVTGVIMDRPANADIMIKAIMSADFSKATAWMEDDFAFYTFALFKQKPNLRQFEKKLATLSKKYVQPELNAAGADKYSASFEAEWLKDVHFSQGKLVDTPKGNKQFNYIFSILAAFILIIALLNYINLSTAKATERAKEVGIRKVSGARQTQLISQFMFESFILVSMAWVLAVGLVQLTIPVFNRLLDTGITMDWSQNILPMALIFLITLLLAGLYPAFVLSGFKPARILKGNWRNSQKGFLLRKTVTIFQFGIAAALILGTTIIYRQMKFVEQKNLGFNKEKVLNIYTPIDSALRPSVSAFSDALRQRSEIRGITAGSGLQQEGIPMATTFAEMNGKKREWICNYYYIDQQFLPLLDIRLAEGRNLSDQFSTDKQEGFLVNEAFVRSMGWSSGLGKSIEGFGHKGKVVGVVRNFYYKSLHNVVEPLIMIYNTFPVSTVMVKIKPEDLGIVKEIYKKILPGRPFDYGFLDEAVDKQYRKDRITMSLFNGFTILAILVSCLGLYGLVALIAVQRTKEIGIRKVLGATMAQLLGLLSKDFLKLVCVALLIALPLAGIAMNKWLGSYAYHIRVEWWMFFIPVVFVLMITLLVISRQLFKAALANPVTSLRSE